MTGLHNTKENQGDISQFTYSHDQIGNRLTMVTSQGTHNYTYDNISQLTHVDYPAGDPFPDKTYNYDPVGNRDSTVNGGTVDYQNNELNEYTDVGSTSYTSDLRGNLTSDGAQTYAYDLDNRLVSVATDTVYIYDPFGKRIEENVSGTITKYVHSGDQIIEEWEGDTLARKYIYGVGIDEPLVMITSGGAKYYYHFDALGSVRNLTDSTGATITSYGYDVYGAFDLTGNSHGNPYTFAGRQWDPESGLYYYRARYYTPSLGRFLQTDPIGYHDGPNLYTYVENNPINFTDTSGMCSGGGGGSGSKQDLCDYYWDLCIGGDDYGCFAYLICMGFGESDFDDCMRVCLIVEHMFFCEGKDGLDLIMCVIATHISCFEDCI